MATIRTPAYQSDPICQAFEEHKALCLEAWIQKRQGLVGAKAEAARVECDETIRGLEALRDQQLSALGLYVSEGFDPDPDNRGNDWIIDLVALEAEP